MSKEFRCDKNSVDIVQLIHESSLFFFPHLKLILCSLSPPAISPRPNCDARLSCFACHASALFMQLQLRPPRGGGGGDCVGGAVSKPTTRPSIGISTSRSRVLLLLLLPPLATIACFLGLLPGRHVDWLVSAETGATSIVSDPMKARGPIRVRCLPTPS